MPVRVRDEYTRSTPPQDSLDEVFKLIKERSSAPLICMYLDKSDRDMDNRMMEDGWAAIDLAVDGRSDIVIYQRAI